MQLLTDGSLEGLLTAVFITYARRLRVDDILWEPPRQMSLVHTVEPVTTDPALAERVARGIEGKIGPRALYNITHTWLAQLPGQGRWILDYIRLGLAVGPGVDTMLAHAAVAPIWRAVRRVDRETHRLLGLLRFRRTASGVFLALCAPDHHQLPLIAPHFAARMDAPFVVHDERRGISLLCREGEWVLATGPCPLLEDSDDEAGVAALWRMYHRTIANPSRVNYALQRQFMPRRYWKHLTEQPGPASQDARW